MRGEINLILQGNGLRIFFGQTDEATRSIDGPSEQDIAAEKLTLFLLSDLRFKLAKCHRLRISPALGGGVLPGGSK